MLEKLHKGDFTACNGNVLPTTPLPQNPLRQCSLYTWLGPIDMNIVGGIFFFVGGGFVIAGLLFFVGGVFVFDLHMFADSV